MWPLLKQTVVEFIEDECPSMAAALAYYTTFSLPPLLALVIMIASLFIDAQDVRGSVADQIQQLAGPQAAEQVRTVIENIDQDRENRTIWSVVIGAVALIFGATAAFAQLQAALNRAWDIPANAESGGLVAFVFKRLLSFGMIVSIAFLLLVSLALNAVLSALGGQLNALVPDFMSELAITIVNNGTMFLITALLFALVYRFMPDKRIDWRDVIAGAVLTAGLFTVGKFAIGLYLGQSDPGSAFGAAGSLAVILVWVYYSSMIVLFGAEMTQVWAKRRQGQSSLAAGVEARSA